MLLHWNEVAWRTIAVEGMRPPPVAQFYLGLVSMAVFNAVVTIEGEGEPTLPQHRIHGEASSDVAAATAAHDVLVAFFPASRAPWTPTTTRGSPASRTTRRAGAGCRPVRRRRQR